MEYELCHSKKGYQKPNHKYAFRTWKNGRWIYSYPGTPGKLPGDKSKDGTYFYNKGSNNLSIWKEKNSKNPFIEKYDLYNAKTNGNKKTMEKTGSVKRVRSLSEVAKDTKEKVKSYISKKANKTVNSISKKVQKAKIFIDKKVKEKQKNRIKVTSHVTTLN